MPYFVATFWISISLAITGTNFVEIDHHLSELWKKQKGVLFMKHHVVSKLSLPSRLCPSNLYKNLNKNKKIKKMYFVCCSVNHISFIFVFAQTLSQCACDIKLIFHRRILRITTYHTIHWTRDVLLYIAGVRFFVCVINRLCWPVSNTFIVSWLYLIVKLFCLRLWDRSSLLRVCHVIVTSKMSGCYHVANISISGSARGC